ncbi:hypothetical protein LDENG_00166370 [Lucifuga dentata]|nr:hypothetical protein LDENG_00166370 [Lucifuga dentata]
MKAITTKGVTQQAYSQRAELLSGIFEAVQLRLLAWLIFRLLWDKDLTFLSLPASGQSQAFAFKTEDSTSGKVRCAGKGYGDNKPKSSTTAQEVKTLDGIYIEQVVMGYAHCLVIARQETQQEQDKLKKLPEYNPRTI